MIAYLRAQNLSLCSLIIYKATHRKLPREGNVRADTDFDASYCANNACYADLDRDSKMFHITCQPAFLILRSRANGIVSVTGIHVPQN